jgi:hypothetical protein
LPAPAISRSLARSARHGQIITVDSDADQNDFARKKTAREMEKIIRFRYDRSDAGRVARPESRWHVLGSQAPE